MSAPKVLSVEDLSSSEAKWISLRKVNWQDPTGRQRVWECAGRKTRPSAGTDGVTVLALLRSETNAFPLSTVIIEQYRPPIDRYIIEFPAGLIEENETAEEAALRELEEETGYKAEKVVESTPVVVLDPSMTTANGRLVTVSVPFADQLIEPKAQPDEGEFIVTKVVELEKLYETLKGYDSKGFVIDARLSNFAAGYDMKRRIAAGHI